jgi:hypothetical protein
VGTPICVPGKDFVELGRIASMEHNHKAVDVARAGQSVAMKIEPGAHGGRPWVGGSAGLAAAAAAGTLLAPANLQPPPLTRAYRRHLDPAGNSVEQSRAFGRHFDETDQLVSRISRESINALKNHFKVRAGRPAVRGRAWQAGRGRELPGIVGVLLPLLLLLLTLHPCALPGLGDLGLVVQDDMSKEDWRLVVRLKSMFKIT